jgi:dipeptidase D
LFFKSLSSLVGAFALKPDFLSGDFLINIDSVIEGEITIGSAGGIDVVSTLISEFETSPSFHKKYSLKVENLVGGHSGVDINKNRANAIKVLTRVWNFISKGNEEWFKVMEFKSGSKSNAIPREAELILSMDPRLELKLKAEVDKIMKLIQAEFKTPEPNMSYSLKRLDSKVVNKVFTKQTAERLKNVLQIYPTGVVAMSPDLPDLVETSLNLAVIQMKNGNVEISSSIRSSVQSAMNNTVVTVQNLIELAGGSTKTIGAYPGWKPDLDAPLLKLAQSAYKELFNKDVRVAAIHAGLETGVIGSKFPKMQMISVGSQVEGPHSPDERILISSVPKSYALVAKTLEKLAK